MSVGGGLAAYNLNLDNFYYSEWNGETYTESGNLSSNEQLGGGMYFANSNIDLIYCDISLNIVQKIQTTQEALQ